MNATTVQLGKFLKIQPARIVRYEEWAQVFFVIIKEMRPRFVSKKAIVGDCLLNKETLQNGLTFEAWQLERRKVHLYYNSYFALRMSRHLHEIGFDYAVVFIDGEVAGSWHRNNQTWFRSCDKVRAKSVDGILSRYIKEGVIAA